jgi:hypothetical protein
MLMTPAQVDRERGLGGLDSIPELLGQRVESDPCERGKVAVEPFICDLLIDIRAPGLDRDRDFLRSMIGPFPGCRNIADV